MKTKSQRMKNGKFKQDQYKVHTIQGLKDCLFLHCTATPNPQIGKEKKSLNKNKKELTNTKTIHTL